MATYTHIGSIDIGTRIGSIPIGDDWSTFIAPWYNVSIGNTPVGTPTNTLLVRLNSDGTETRVIGTGYTYSGTTPTGGTITKFIAQALAEKPYMKPLPTLVYRWWH